MLRGLYTAGNALLTQTNRMDVVANNLSNAQTAGYKADTVVSRSFDDLLMERINDPGVNAYKQVGPTNPGIHVDQVMIDFMQGAIEQTARNTDFALIGDGFFEVSTPNGTRYTRAGNFQLNSEGELLTAEGYSIMGEDGAVKVNPDNFSVNSDGEIFSDGVNVNKFKIFDFADKNQLRKEKSGLFMSNQAGFRANNVVVRQSALEASNIDLNKEYVTMLEIARSTESNQKIIQMMDQTLGRAVNDIGRV